MCTCLRVLCRSVQVIPAHSSLLALTNKCIASVSRVSFFSCFAERTQGDPGCCRIADASVMFTQRGTPTPAGVTAMVPNFAGFAPFPQWTGRKKV